MPDRSDEAAVIARTAPVPPSVPDAHRKLTLWLFLLLCCVYVTLTRGHFWSTDEVTVYQQTRSLREHGDLDTARLPNSLPGRGGRFYGVYGPGQSVLALPFYATGKAVHRVLERWGARQAIDVLAGPLIGDPGGSHWGGEVEIFFVNLLNAVVVALAGAVFFRFQLRLGVDAKWAVAATLVLALATHLPGFATGFFQHGAETLFALWSFYLLFRNSETPQARTRVAAGIAAGAMLLVRVNTLALLPALTLYLAFQGRRRRSDAADRLRQMARECLPFLLPVGLAMLAMGGVNAWKFGAFGLRGAYAKSIPFNTPLLVGLYGNLFSVGASIFLFSPILWLAPVYFRPFARRRPAEAAAILGMAAGSLLLYSKVYLWHGQWAFGPRYLVHLVPLLLLPLGAWLQESARARVAAAPLVAAGLLVMALHVGVNVSYVYYHEGYIQSPAYEYLWIPEKCQLLAHWRALAAWDNRVDLWLVDTWRSRGGVAALPILTCLLWAIAWCIRQVTQYSRTAISQTDSDKM